MEDRLRMLLLKILDDNGNITNLEKAGYQYVTIAKEYSKLINEELVILNQKLQFVLSEKGKIELESLKEKINKNGYWKIDAFDKYKVDKIGIYDIFIE